MTDRAEGRTIPRGEAGGAQGAEAVRVAVSATIDLPMPPTSNHIWKRSGRKTHLSNTYVAWRRIAGMLLLAARFPTFPGAYAIDIQIPRAMRGDVGNREKAVNDLLVLQRVVTDDRYCERITLSRADNIPAKTCRITVTEL